MFAGQRASVNTTSYKRGVIYPFERITVADSVINHGIDHWPEMQIVNDHAIATIFYCLQSISNNCIGSINDVF